MNSEKKQKLSEYATTLNNLQAKIESADAIAIEHGKIAMQLAMEAGTILNQAKGLVHYGTWKKWLAENVKGVTERTAQNYMKLAKHVSFLADCDCLSEAYRLLRIKKKPAANNVEMGRDSQPATSDETPKQDTAQFQNKLSQAKSLMIQRVSGEIQNAGVDWNVSTWTIKNNRPISDDATNKLATTLAKLTHFVAFRDTTLDTEVETRAKIQIVLTEMLNAIIKASRPQQTETMEIVPSCSIEANAPPVEIVEKMAA